MHSIPMTMGSETDIIIKYITIQNIRYFTVSSKHINEINEMREVVVTRWITIFSHNNTTKDKIVVANKNMINNADFLSLGLLSKEKYKNISIISTTTFIISMIF